MRLRLFIGSDIEPAYDTWRTDWIGTDYGHPVAGEIINFEGGRSVLVKLVHWTLPRTNVNGEMTEDTVIDVFAEEL